MSTICGHDRSELQVWLRVANEIPGTTPCDNCGCSACNARNAALDPAKLAEIITALLRERGATAQLRLLVQDGEWPDVEILYFPNQHKQTPTQKLGLYIRATGKNPDLTMPQARKLALRLLQWEGEFSIEKALEGL